jgi:hypothetical protein
LHGRAQGHDLVSVEVAVWGAPKQLSDVLSNQRYPCRATNEHDFVDGISGESCVLQCLMARGAGPLKDGPNQVFKAGPIDLSLDCCAGQVGPQCGRVSVGELALGLLGCPNCGAVGDAISIVDSSLLQEHCSESLIEVITAKVGIACSAEYLEYAIIQAET